VASNPKDVWRLMIPEDNADESVKGNRCQAFSSQPDVRGCTALSSAFA